MRIAQPLDRHRGGARNVAIEDRRANAARAVALHPAAAGESEARKLLAEILHHVVALELAVDEHIETDFLLPFDRGAGFGAQVSGVGGKIGRASCRERVSQYV